MIHKRARVTREREIDYLVARRVMGYWTERRMVHWGDRDHCEIIWVQPHSSIDDAWMYASVGLPGGNTWSDGLPRFSTNILAALLIVRKIGRSPGGDRRRFAEELKWCSNLHGHGYGYGTLRWFLFDANMPWEICLAALRAERIQQATSNLALFREE